MAERMHKEGDYKEAAELLAIIQEAAMGIIVANQEGQIKYQNKWGGQMTGMLFAQAGLPPENILKLLEMIAPGIATTVAEYSEPSGFILTQRKQTVVLDTPEGEMERHFFYSINRVAEDSYVYSFDDITDYHQTQEELARVNQQLAIDRSRFEIASGVLHDIGNATVGFSSHLTRTRRLLQETEIKRLQQLRAFLQNQKKPLAGALGEAKAGALLQLVSGLEENFEQTWRQLNKTTTEQMGIVSHISDILNIQRHYVSGEQRAKEDVHLRNLVYDALAILLASVEKRGLKLQTDLPEDTPKILGDRTKLIQVIINLLKNALEAIDRQKPEQGQISIRLKQNEESLALEISDNGCGFEPKMAEQLYQRKFSSKKEGGGIGLAAARSIAQSHDGTLTISSEGPGKGATARLALPLKLKQEDE